MTQEEIIEQFIDRHLNVKTNNLIIISDQNNSILESIPDISKITLSYDIFDINSAYNIKIDMNKVNVRDILNYVLLYLEGKKCFDKRYDIELNNNLSLLRFENILRNNNLVVQLFFYNLENLSVDEQMLFNELYYCNSSYFNITSFVEEEFKTYFLTKERVLDSRDNFTKYYILKYDI